MEPAVIPDAFLDLINGPTVASIATTMPNGYPQVTPIWCLYRDDVIYTTTGWNFQKRRNMQRDPKVTLFITNPVNHLRFIEIRGNVIEITEKGAISCLDELSMIYTGKAPYYGEIMDIKYLELEKQVLVKILPIKVNAVDFRRNNDG